VRIAATKQETSSTAFRGMGFPSESSITYGISYGKRRFASGICRSRSGHSNQPFYQNSRNPNAAHGVGIVSNVVILDSCKNLKLE